MNITKFKHPHSPTLQYHDHEYNSYRLITNVCYSPENPTKCKKINNAPNQQSSQAITGELKERRNKKLFYTYASEIKRENMN